MVMGFNSCEDDEHAACSPVSEKDKAFEAWLEKRIDHIEHHVAVTPRSTPNSIASGGRLTAYREILNYVRTHPKT